MKYSSRSFELESRNNLLNLYIDWYEDLNGAFDQTFSWHTNVLNAIYGASETEVSFVEDIATGERYWQRPGTIVLIPPQRTVRYFHTADTALITIHFRLDFAWGLDIFAQSDHVFRLEAPALVETIRQIGKAEDLMGAMLELRIVIQLIALQYYRQLTPYKFIDAAIRYNEVLKMIAAKIDAGTSVTDLAQAMGWRRETFSRNFRRDFGITPTEWLHHVLTDRVAAFLVEPDLSLHSIARKLAFSSEFSLSRFFKRETGFSPRAYRERCRIQNHSASGDSPTPDL